MICVRVEAYSVNTSEVAYFNVLVPPESVSSSSSYTHTKLDVKVFLKTEKMIVQQI